MLAWLGGSFNPIHQGHIQLVIEARDILPLKQVSLLPCRQQALKKILNPDNEQRLSQLKQAIKSYPFLSLDDTELKFKQSINYTVNTLEYFSQIYPDNTIIFIMGSDSLVHLHQWKNWQELLHYGNLLIFNRVYDTPAHPKPKIVQQEVLIWIKQHLTSVSNFVSLYKVEKTPIYGKILHLNMRKPLPISSTNIRQKSTLPIKCTSNN